MSKIYAPVAQSCGMHVNYCQLSSDSHLTVPAPKISTRRQAKRRFEFFTVVRDGWNIKKRKRIRKKKAKWKKLWNWGVCCCWPTTKAGSGSGSFLPSCHHLSRPRRCHNLCGAVYAGNGLICYDLSVELLNYWFARFGGIFRASLFPPKKVRQLLKQKGWANGLYE